LHANHHRKGQRMNPRGTPIFYIAELTDIPNTTGKASTVVNFNDSGVIRSVAFAALDSTGNVLDMNSFLVNIYRQNQKGMVTQAAIASTICTAPGGSLVGTGTGFTLPPMMGDFRVEQLTQLVVEVSNKNATDADLVHVVFALNADS